MRRLYLSLVGVWSVLSRTSNGPLPTLRSDSVDGEKVTEEEEVVAVEKGAVVEEEDVSVEEEGVAAEENSVTIGVAVGENDVVVTVKGQDVAVGEECDAVEEGSVTEEGSAYTRDDLT